jgi:hypothetical protein
MFFSWSPPLVLSATSSICANWPPPHRIRRGTTLAAPNLVPRAQPSGEPSKRRDAGCLCNFGPKPNPFAAGRQVKNKIQERILINGSEGEIQFDLIPGNWVAVWNTIFLFSIDKS